MSVNTKMKAIADEIRTLSGTTETMSLDAMATNVGAANDEVDSQTELLAQAVAALEGKASGGSGGGDAVETCTVTVTAMEIILAYGATRYVDGILMCESDAGYGAQEITLNNVVKGSCLTVTFLGFDSSSLDVTNCTLKLERIADIDSIVTAFYKVND